MSSNGTKAALKWVGGFVWPAFVCTQVVDVAAAKQINGASLRQSIIGAPSELLS